MTKVKCTKCNDSGWEKIEKDGKEFLRKCKCQGVNPYVSRCKNANIPELFIGSKLSEFKLNDNTKRFEPIIKKMNNFIEQYPAVQEGLILHGKTGVGKTRILSSIASAIVKNSPELDVFYIDWNDLVRDMKSGESHNFRDFSIINDLIHKLCHSSLLIIDELGSSKPSQWVFDNIYYVINYRYNRKKITLFATNYPDETSDGSPTLTERVGDRVRSRIYEMAKSYYLYGLDYRKTDARA